MRNVLEKRSQDLRKLFSFYFSAIHASVFLLIFTTTRSFDVGVSSNMKEVALKIKSFEHFSLWQLNPRCQECIFLITGHGDNFVE